MPTHAPSTAALKGRPPASADALTAIRDKVREARDLLLEIEDIEQQLDDKKEKLNAIVGGGKEVGTLPTLMADRGVNRLELQAEGNLPAFDCRLKNYYKAVLPKDPELRAKGIKWLEEHDYDDVIKTVFSVQVGMHERKLAKEIAAALTKLNVFFEEKTDAPWTSLTALVKTMVEDEGVTPPLDLLGAVVGQVSEVKRVKEKKTKSRDDG